MEVDEKVVRTQYEEVFCFGFLNYPRYPVLHSYSSMIIGILLVIFDLHWQLPAVLPSDPELLPAALEGVNVNTWYSFPFLILCVMLKDKLLYRRLCDAVRIVLSNRAMEYSHDDIDIIATAEFNTGKLILARVIGIVSVFLTWFVLFNLGLILLIWWR